MDSPAIHGHRFGHSSFKQALLEISQSINKKQKQNNKLELSEEENESPTIKVSHKTYHFF